MDRSLFVRLHTAILVVVDAGFSQGSVLSP